MIRFILAVLSSTCTLTLIYNNFFIQNLYFFLNNTLLRIFWSCTGSTCFWLSVCHDFHIFYNSRWWPGTLWRCWWLEFNNWGLNIISLQINFLTKRNRITCCKKTGCCPVVKSACGCVSFVVSYDSFFPQQPNIFIDLLYIFW